MTLPTTETTIGPVTVCIVTHTEQVVHKSLRELNPIILSLENWRQRIETCYNLLCREVGKFNTIFIEVDRWENQIISVRITSQPSGWIRTFIISHPDKNVTKFVIRHVTHKNSKGKKTLLLLNFIPDIENAKFSEDRTSF
jgi:hypothetical protein